MKILGIIEKITGVYLSNYDVHDDLLETGILDSFAFVEMIMELQSSHQVEIPSDIMDSKELRTLYGLENLINGN